MSLDDAINLSLERTSELIALDEALTAFSKIDPEKARLVELRYFGGLSVEETAQVLGVSIPTVVRHWSAAKARLYHEIKKS